MSKEDDRINKRKIESYQRLVRCLTAENKAIVEFGVFSQEAADAENESLKARRNFELWRKK
jgi:hypothetical protein